MKIKRLYESNISDIKNKFERYKLKQKKFHELEKETNNFQELFISSLKKYFILHPELAEEKNATIDENIIIKEFKVIDINDNYFVNYTLVPDDYLQLDYWESYRCENRLYSAWFKEEDFDDFLRFMDNLEAYVDSKKYNI